MWIEAEIGGKPVMINLDKASHICIAHGDEYPTIYFPTHNYFQITMPYEKLKQKILEAQK